MKISLTTVVLFVLSFLMSQTIPEEEMVSQSFVVAFNEIQKRVNATAHEKGWYDSPIANVISEVDSPAAHVQLESLEDARRVALAHAELSEGLEGLRHGNGPSDHIPDYSCIEEEYADVIIRIMDHAQERGWRIAEAIEAKRAYNLGRAYKHGGKKF